MTTKTKLHVIGDSHVSLFSGKDEVIPNYPTEHEDLLPQFKTYRLGAFLAYSLIAEGHEGRTKLFSLVDSLPKRAKVLLVFGEIDCRAHIVKQARAQDRDIRDVAETVAERYFSVIQEVATLRKVIVWGAIPQSSAAHSSNKFPTVGNQRERNEAAFWFDNTLRKLCEDAGIPFASIFNELVDSEFISRESFFYDTAHLDQRALPLAIEALSPYL